MGKGENGMVDCPPPEELDPASPQTFGRLKVSAFSALAVAVRGIGLDLYARALPLRPSRATGHSGLLHSGGGYAQTAFRAATCRSVSLCGVDHLCALPRKTAASICPSARRSLDVSRPV